MKKAVEFFANVSNGEQIFEVPLPEALGGNLPPGKIWTVPEAVSYGIDLSTVLREDGKAIVSREEMLRLRRMNAIAANELEFSADGVCELPMLASLMERAANPQLRPAVTFFESVPAAGIPNQESESSKVDMISQRTGITEVKSLPLAEKRDEKRPLEVPRQYIPQDGKGVYVPSAQVKEEFLKADIRGKDNGVPSSELADKILARYNLRQYEEETFCFIRRKGVYEKISAQAMGMMIDEAVGYIIRKEDQVGKYREVERYLRLDSRLKVTSEMLLPIQCWVFLDKIVDTITGQIYENDGTYFVRSAMSQPYIPNATCPTFDTFLTAISGGNKNLMELLWEMLGYAFSPDTFAKNFFVFVGPKDTGKSLLANVIAMAFNEGAVSFLSANDFSGRFDLAELKGKSVNLCMDLPDTPLKKEAVGRIKSLTGGDRVRSDQKYKDSVNFINTSTFIFGSNHVIRTESADAAFEERLITIPFCFPIPPEKQDKHLKEKLEAELPGIIVKAMAAYCRLRNNNYVFPKVEIPDNLSRRYDYEKVICKFVQDLCVFNETLRISTEELYGAFCNFCLENQVPQIEKAEFSREFKVLFGDQVQHKKVKIDGTALQGYVGIGLGRR